MRKFVLVVLCLFLGWKSWSSLEYATAAGWVKTERNVALFVDGPLPAANRTEVLRRESLERLRRDVPGIFQVLVAFGAPAVAVAVFRRHPIAQYALLAVALVLLVADLGIAEAPDGGDRKGCTQCDGSFFLHLAFGFLALMASALSLAMFLFAQVWRYRRVRLPERTQQTVAADRREDAPPAER
jgi:hypothetical protein